MSTTGSSSVLRTAALFAVVIGAAGSVTMMLRTGSRNQSSVLMLMFAVWDLAPFVALALLDMASQRWPTGSRMRLHIVMLIVSLGCLAAYGGLIPMPAQSKPAFAYLVVPVIAWLLIFAMLSLAAIMLRRNARNAG